MLKINKKLVDNEVDSVSIVKERANNKLTTLPDEIVKEAAHNSITSSSLKQNAKTYMKAQVTVKESLENLEATSNLIREYEVVDKMFEINQKRRVSVYTDVAKGMVNITADIVTLSWVGAIVGTSVKTIVCAESLAYAVAKGIQQIHKDKKTYDNGEITNLQAKNIKIMFHTLNIFSEC